MEPQKKNFKIVSDKKTARVILPNMLTLIGVCIGLTSIRFALDGRFELAIIAIMFAALIDGLDGRIARLIKGTSKVGKELDSLTDMISFGVAPAFIMFFWKLNTLGRFGWLLCLIYVICVALRLARFNVNSGQEPSWKDNFFEGVPSPAGGILVLTPLIISLSGTELSKKEKIILSKEKPWGVILFKRNLKGTPSGKKNENTWPVRTMFYFLPRKIRCSLGMKHFRVIC